MILMGKKVDMDWNLIQKGNVAFILGHRMKEIAFYLDRRGICYKKVIDFEW